MFNKKFVKKTRKGNVMTVVREHYMRDDIWCGSQSCRLCSDETTSVTLEAFPDDTSTSTFTTTMSALTLRGQNNASDGFHYLIPDTNVLLAQIDIFEHSCIRNVIILQTVLQETKNRNIHIHNRVRELIADPQRHFFFFANEHRRDTYVEQKPDESVNDRNDRAIRVSTQWYQKHIMEQFKDNNDNVVYVVLLTNDAANFHKAVAEGIICYTIERYVKSISSTPELADLLADSTNCAHNDDGDFARGAAVKYPEHISISAMHIGLKRTTNALVQGKFSVDRHNYLQAYVTAKDSKGIESRILIRGRLNMNRAVTGDVVAVEVLPRDKWVRPSDVIKENENKEEEDEEAIEQESEVVSSEEADNTLEPCGRIVGVIKRNWRSYCGVLMPVKKNKNDTSCLFIAADRQIPKVRIRTHQAEALMGQHIIVNIDGWACNSRYPNGHFVRALGCVGDVETESEVLLIENDHPHHPFSPRVLSCLPTMPWCITTEDEAARRDLRGLVVCSVDPPGCTDIDDALSVRDLGDNTFEVGVHIADVSHFVAMGTAIDDEAANRGTTVYLTDKRIDMLPELLGTNLCSLRSDVDRFAFSTLWIMTADAKVKSVSFFKSIIRSRAALTYQQAQLRIDDSTQMDDVTKGLRILNGMAKKMRARRMESGALTLSSPEVSFQLDNESHDPISLDIKELHETNSMVEEFMLFANVAVATRLYEEFPQSALLRRHPAPPASNFEELIKAAELYGVHLDVSSNKSLATSLDNIQEQIATHTELVKRGDDPSLMLGPGPYLEKLLRMATTRCMYQAQYMCSGSFAEPDYYHYGLAMPLYTHFTSPIRRYADLIVHRLLNICVARDRQRSLTVNVHTGMSSDASVAIEGVASSLDNIISPSNTARLLDKGRMEGICENLNYRSRCAQQASRASVDLHTHVFFKGRVVQEEAYVTKVRKNAVVVIVPRYGFEHILYFDTASASSGINIGKAATSTPVTPNFSYDSERHALIADNVVIGMFERLVVRISIDDSDEQHRKLVLNLVEPRIVGISVTDNTNNDIVLIEKKRKGSTIAEEVDAAHRTNTLKKKKIKK